MKEKQISEYLANLFEAISRRCIVLYFVIGMALVIIVDHKTVARTTLDYLGNQHTYMVNFAKGKTGFRKDLVEDAVRYYNNFVNLNSQSASGYSVLGYCYYHLGEFTKAIKYYEKAIEIEPDLFGLYYNLGKIYEKKGDSDSAIELFLQAVEVSPNKTLVYPYVVYPHQPKHSKYKEEDVEKKLIYLKHGYIESLKSIILKYRKDENYLKMLEISNNGIKIAQNDRDFFFFYAGLSSFKLGNYNDAVNMFREAININPNHQESYIYLSAGLMKLKLEGPARVILQKTKKMKKKSKTYDSSDEEFSSGLYYYPPFREIKIKNKQKYILI